MEISSSADQLLVAAMACGALVLGAWLAFRISDPSRPRFFALLVAPLILVLLALVFFRSGWRVRREFARAQHVRIGQVSDGEVVKVVGRVVGASNLLRAPGSGRTCAYFGVTVEKKVVTHSRTGRRETWHMATSGESGVDFRVADETGVATVRIDGARLSVRGEEASGLAKSPDALPTGVRKLFEDDGLELISGLAGLVVGATIAGYRYVEHRLDPGEPIAVLARAKRTDGGLELLAIDDAHPLLITDDPRCTAVKAPKPLPDAGATSATQPAWFAWLDRNGQDLATWQSTLRSLLRRGDGYRDVPFTVDDLATILRDASAPAERTLAAAIGLKAAAASDSEKLIRASAASAEPVKLRVALEHLLHDRLTDEDIDAAIDPTS